MKFNNSLFIQLFSVLVVMYSCSHSATKTNVQSRSIANLSGMGKILIQQLAKEMKISESQIEREILKYIKSPAKGSQTQINSIGITKSEAWRIKSLSDELPYTPKVLEWTSKNLDHIFPNVDINKLSRAFEKSYGKSMGVKSHYKDLKVQTQSIRDRLTHRARSFKSKKHMRKKLETLKSKKDEKQLKEILDIVETRGGLKNNRNIISNGRHIVESAFLITKKTGISSMGKGCDSFLKNAPEKIFSMKANIDIVRAQIIQKMSLEKNLNKPFKHYTEIPKARRLAQSEIDTGTKEAFKKVLGHTDEEAELALSVLKKKPCQLY